MTNELQAIDKISLYEDGRELETLAASDSSQGPDRQVSIEQAQSGKIQAGVSVAQLLWDIVKSGNSVAKADGNFTNVLGESDTDPLNYEDSRPFESPAYTFTAESHGGHGVTMATLKYQIVGHYHATYAGSSDSVKPGLYIPSIHVKVIKASTMWGYTLNAEGSVGNVVNIGESDNIIPQIKVGMKVKVSSINTVVKSFWFHINARDGFTGLA